METSRLVCICKLLTGFDAMRTLSSMSFLKKYKRFHVLKIFTQRVSVHKYQRRDQRHIQNPVERLTWSFCENSYCKCFNTLIIFAEGSVLDV